MKFSDLSEKDLMMAYKGYKMLKETGAEITTSVEFSVRQSTNTEFKILASGSSMQPMS